MKMRLRHSEFGITAGFPSRSWRPTQITKAGANVTDNINVTSVPDLVMLDTLSVIVLFSY